MAEDPAFDRADVFVVDRFAGRAAAGDDVDHPDQPDERIERILAVGRGAEAVVDLVLERWPEPNVEVVGRFTEWGRLRPSIRLPALADDAVRLLTGYQWPGNIRELENVIHFALLVAAEREIRPEHLKITGGWSGNKPIASSRTVDPRSEQPLQHIAEELRKLFAGPPAAHFDDLEKLIVDEAFRFCEHNQVHTANLLGISRNVVRTLLKRHGYLGIEETDAA